MRAQVAAAEGGTSTRGLIKGNNADHTIRVNAAAQAQRDRALFIEHAMLAFEEVGGGIEFRQKVRAAHAARVTYRDWSWRPNGWPCMRGLR